MKTGGSAAAPPPSRQVCDGQPTNVVYVLGTADPGRRLTYVGWTNDLTRRLSRHNDGVGARFTRGRRWVLLHVEHFADRRAAQSREWHLKRDRVLRRTLAATLPQG